MTTLTATISMGSGQYRWDKLDLILRENHSVIADFRIKSRKSAIDVYQQLITAQFSDKIDDIIIDIDNLKYIFSYPEWQAMFPCFKQWFEAYVESELNESN